MCLISPIGVGTCPKKGRAGINKLWAIPCESVEDIVFDPVTRKVTAWVIDALALQPGFVPIEFEKDTAFFNQAKVKIKNSTNVTQTISFVEPQLTNETRNALEDLAGCCCLIVIVRDNANHYHVMGVSYDPITNTWQAEDAATGEGSANTGADPTADSAEYIETIAANTAFYAPHFDGVEADIPLV